MLITDDGVKLGTVEHLMAALAALGIDNAIIEVDAAEIPIMDGSASPFIFLLQQAGIEEQNAAKRFIKITKKVRVEDGDKWAEFIPFNGFKIDFGINFAHPAIDATAQRLVQDLSNGSFTQDISRARTFGFMKDIEYLQARNLALGGSLDNAIVLDEYKILNPNGLRYPDEFVRHKILDAVGDLFMLGNNIIGEVRAFKSGHGLNNALARELLANPQCYEVVIFEEQLAPVCHFAASFA